jgi:hypothetical protein
VLPEPVALLLDFGGVLADAQTMVRASIAKLSYDWAWRNNWALRPGHADVGAAILMRSPRTEEPGEWPEPDAVVEDGFGLLELLTAAGIGKTH